MARLHAQNHSSKMETNLIDQQNLAGSQIHILSVRNCKVSSL